MCKHVQRFYLTFVILCIALFQQGCWATAAQLPLICWMYSTAVPQGMIGGHRIKVWFQSPCRVNPRAWSNKTGSWIWRNLLFTSENLLLISLAVPKCPVYSLPNTNWFEGIPVVDYKNLHLCWSESRVYPRIQWFILFCRHFSHWIDDFLARSPVSRPAQFTILAYT